jgi:transcriptional regulator with XRE-family HTH domain
MTTFEDMWEKLPEKEYRGQYALSLLKRSVAFQIKTLRKKHCGSQAILAERSGLTQGVVSRAEDQDYGNLTLNTVGRIAGGLDMAFIGKFVPFSELVKFSLNLSEEQFWSIPTFNEENEDDLSSHNKVVQLVPPRPQLGLASAFDFTRQDGVAPERSFDSPSTKQEKKPPLPSPATDELVGYGPQEKILIGGKR